MLSKGFYYKSFIAIFIIGLLFPNTGLFRGQENARIVARENRKITAFPKESLKKKSFYTSFEKWYQDRLRYRDKAILAWKKMNYEFGVILSDSIFLGKDKWLFNRGNTINSYRNKKEKALALKRIQDYCLKNNAQFVFLLAPTKEAIYADYFPLKEQRKHKPYAFWEKQVTDSLNAKKIHYLSVTKKLMQDKVSLKEPVYFKDDHHWSYYGAAAASDLLLQQFNIMSKQASFKELSLDIIKDNAFKEYSYANTLGFGQTYKAKAPWSSKFTQELYLKDCYTGKEQKLKEIPSNNILWGRIVNGEGIVINKSLKNGHTLLILGDSYSSYMVPYLSQHFGKIVSTHYRDSHGKKKGVDLKRLLATYKPDYVLLEMLGNSFYASNDKQNLGRITLPKDF